MNIEINKLKKSYNSSWTLFIDKLNISTGEIVGIIGNNGCRKNNIYTFDIGFNKARLWNHRI